jgi:N-acetylmuramoyl-L-alanine amidase
VNLLLIAIDAGHGGTDPGATANGLLEKDLTLQLALKTGIYLRTHYDCGVVYTRNKDFTLELSDRSKMANMVKADLFCSFHINSFNQESKGFETYRYPGTSGKTLDLQKNVHEEVMNVLKKHQIVDRGMKQKNLAVVRETNMPALLTETLFISNPKEANLLKSEDFLNQVAKAHAIGLSKTAGLKRITSQPEVRYYLKTGTFVNKEEAEVNAQMLTERYGWLVHILKA